MSDMTLQDIEPLTPEQADDLLETVKFWPFGNTHEGRFFIEKREGKTKLCVTKMGWDSREWVFEDEWEPDLEHLHSQEFSMTINHHDMRDAESLLRKVATLAAYAMAHEGLEWLRLEDGSLVYDPHKLPDVQVLL